MNDDRQNQSGGLFSDEFETPKRENPYLKKNREKTASAKKKETGDKPAREENTLFAAREEAPAPRASRDSDTPTRKRTFSDWMFEHVKLIATIATVLVVLALVLITDVVTIVENAITQSQQADKEEITLTYVKGLTEKSTPITWNDLKKFRYDSSDAKDSVTWMLSVKGTSYELWISGVSTDKPPMYVYLYDMRTGDRLVLGEEDFDTFIEEHSK